MNNQFDNQTVSVIIPVYNAEMHIGKTIDSALGQTYKDIEIVLADDCSTDNSAQIINGYLINNKNIVYHRLEENSGAAVARNKAIMLAKGRYLAFLDSDDIWYPYKTEKQLELMKRLGAAISYTAIEMINDDDELIKGKRNVIERVDYNFLLRNTMLATSTVIIDRSITGTFQMPLLRSGQDYASWLMLLRNGTIAYGINEALVKYRKGKKSLSANKIKNIKKVWNIQVKNENINPIFATYNSINYAYNAFRKYYL